MNMLCMAMKDNDFLPSLTVVQECPTRWWSMLRILQRILKLWGPITITIVQAEKKELMLSDSDINYI